MDWFNSTEDTDPFNAPVTKVADYMMVLKEAGMSLNTIKSHKTGICTTIEAVTGINHSENIVISRLIQALTHEIPRVIHSVPDWNLVVVLRSFMKPPFEPLVDTPLKYLTMKTIFLVAWASAARVSELHAFTLEPGHYKLDTNSRFVDLYPDAKFLAKNQVASDPPRKFRIKSIKGFVPDSDPEVLLCPVIALRVYVKRTQAKRQKTGTKRIFVGIMKDKPLSIHSIAYWIREAIREGYFHAQTQDVPSLNRVTAHEVRAVSTSLAVHKHIPIKEVMKKGFWKTDTCFTSYYLKDLAKYTDSNENLITVAAGFTLQL